MKGFTRSMKRGQPALQEMVRLRMPFKATVDITGATGTANAATFRMGGLPQGNLLFLGAIVYASVDGGTDAQIINNWNGDYAIGTAPNADVDLGDAGDADVIPSTALDAGASDKLAPLTRGASTTSQHGVIVDNTDGSLELNFNLLVDDGVVSNTLVGTFLVSGVFHAAIVVLGDD